ncbi:MAG: diguanylate cyclase [Thiobacillus sp.]|nr:diguanylate cyclase [Thiobacillus sp.]
MTEDPSRLPKRMARLILLGFAVLIGLMSVLVLNSVLNMRAQDRRVSEIVELRNRKIELATDLLKATYNRHNSLVYQAIANDPFEQDEHFQQYIKWGYEVGKARNALRAMPLDAFEQDQIAQQDKLIGRIVELHEQISDLARQGRYNEAREAIAVTLRPFNLDFIDSVDQLEHYERELIQRALDDARQASRRAIFVDIGLGGALLLLACLIAYLTYRQMGRHADTIGEQMRTLERTGLQLRHEATHDPLTGLPNRSLFYHRLMEALAHAKQDRLKATVLYVDLDEFKPVNDQHGHAVGDSLLQIVAGRLLGSVRATDTVARLGGDEFAVILLGVGEPEQIDAIKAEIKRNLHSPLELGGIDLQPSCSCGHAVYPDDGDSMDTLLHAADSRMYEIKRRRKAG